MLNNRYGKIQVTIIEQQAKKTYKMSQKVTQIVTKNPC